MATKKRTSTTVTFRLPNETAAKLDALVIHKKAKNNAELLIWLVNEAAKRETITRPDGETVPLEGFARELAVMDREPLRVDVIARYLGPEGLSMHERRLYDVVSASPAFEGVKLPWEERVRALFALDSYLKDGGEIAEPIQQIKRLVTKKKFVLIGLDGKPIMHIDEVPVDIDFE